MPRELHRALNSFRRYHILRTDLADIGFHRVDSAALPGMYYTLVFHRLDGSHVGAEVRGGRTRPGKYLDTVRTRLRAWRDAVIDDASVRETGRRTGRSRNG